MNFALILSGGTGTRFHAGGGIPKQYLKVAEKPVIVYTLEKFQNNADTDAVVIVAAPEWRDRLKSWMEKYQIKKFIDFALPGETRQESILNGLEVCLQNAADENDVVLVHDAVRPLVSDSLLSQCYAVAGEFGGCMPVLPIYDTTYQSADGNRIDRLLDRNTLFAGQAPEAYRLRAYAEINRSVSRFELNHYNGSSEIAFRHGLHIRMIPGDDRNFKITTTTDLERFQAVLEKSERAGHLS